MPTKSLQATIFGVDKASPVFDKVGKSADDMAGDVEQSGTRMGNAFKKGAAMAAGALAAVGFADFVKGTITEASNLQQNMGAVESVFKSTAGTITKFGETSADTVGIAKQDYFELATVFGSQLKNMGLAADELAPKTNDLVQLGADLSSMYGGTAAEAVQAISSLLRGERDPIERYGVSIKQASINAYELANGLDTSTAEAKTASDTQATLALLLQQTSDAQGNFARESDTLAGAQQRATAKFKEAQAEIGQRLLPIVTDLTTFAAEDLVPILSTVADVLGGVIDIIDDVPGPVKLALAALLGFKLFQQTETFSKLSTGVRGFREEMALQKGLAAAQGVELSQMGAAAATAQTRMGALAKSLGKGALLAGGAVVIGSIIEGFTHVNQSVQAVTDSVHDLGQQLADNNGKWDESIQKAFESSVVNSDVFQALVADGADYGKTLAALTGQQDLYSDAVQEVADHTGALSVDQMLAIESLMGVRDAAVEQADSIAELRRRQEAASTSTGELSTAQDDARTAAAESSAAARVLAAATSEAGVAQDDARRSAADLRLEWISQSDAQDEARSSAVKFKAAMAEAKSPTQQMKDVIADFAAETGDADTQLKFFSMSIDELTGRYVPLDDAMKMQNDALRDLTDVLTEASKETKKHNEQLLNVDGSINTVTESGSKLYDSVNRYRDAYDHVTTSAYQQAVAMGDSEDALEQAQLAADDARERFVAMADAQGLTTAQAEELADQMGILEGKRLTDKNFGVTATDRASAVMDAVANRKMPDKSFTVTAIEKLVQAKGTDGTVFHGRFAGGGWLSAPGGPTSDGGLFRGSNGEFVVNARAASKYGALLEAINNADGFADGGWIDGRAPGAMLAGTAAMSQVLRVEVTLRGDGVITGAMAKEAGVQIAEAAREQASEAMWVGRNGIRV